MDDDTKLARELEVGHYVAEEDGAFFQVTAISTGPEGHLVFTLANVNGYRSAPPTLTLTVRPSARVRVVEIAAEE